MNETNLFSRVFKKIKLPSDIINDFKNTYVDTIYIDKSSNQLYIKILSNSFVGLEKKDDLIKILKNNFPYINDIDVILKYDFVDMDINQKIDNIKPDLYYLADKFSPLCQSIIEKSKFVIKDNLITIRVKNNSSMFLKKKQLDKILENHIYSCLDIKVQINIEDKILNEEEKEKYIKELIKKENSYQIIVNTSIEAEKPAKQNNVKENFYKDNNGAKFTRTANIKINNDLTKLYQVEKKRLSNDLIVGNELIFAGEIFGIDIRETKSEKYLAMFDIYDGTDSVTVKFFSEKEFFDTTIKQLIKIGKNIIIKGVIQNDAYAGELNIMAKEICPIDAKEDSRVDLYEEKRVELHLHTTMSAMDAVNTPKQLINRAISYGHKAIAITDHGVVQAFPEAMEVSKGKDIKILYGVEGYLVDDLGAVVQCYKNQSFDESFVVFDFETTGLNKENDNIIEIGAAKVVNGIITETFAEFVNPQMLLPEKIKQITNISDDMLKDAKLIDEVLPKFIDFIGDSCLVAHNAEFDMGFLRTQAKKLDITINNSVLDTLELARTLLTELHTHKLNIVAKHLELNLENHHRALDDAKVTAEILIKFLEMLKAENLSNIDEINVYASKNINKSKLKTYHIVILVKNQTGLRNLYELVSKSHLEYFFRRPRMPKSEILKLREGLILGTACEGGELYSAILSKKPEQFIENLIDFYDYLEIQPIDNNMFLLRNNSVKSIDELKDINKQIVAYGEVFNKPVVATCDVHFLNPTDDVYRKVIMNNEGFKDADLQAPLYFRTTEEMLMEFSYLGEQKAKEVVITNTNLIADQIEKIKPIPDDTFPPHIEGAETQIKEISFNKAKELYGDPLPKVVMERMERELNSIIKNGFSVMYIIAQKLVWKSLENGYLVGSRGSVGSSFIATMLSITEVNPLQPHYICPNCKYSDFDSETVREFLGGSGSDMPDKFCPACGTLLAKDGHDIPFETFLGFDGDKEPDIDLNFSGEYQSKAHDYTEELFGKGFVFKAGTIGTVAEKTAYGFVRKYFDEKGIKARAAEINRLKIGCTGIKRTTGQHPGGLMIVPNDHSIYEFCPVQRPANDVTSNVVTTHFDYHSISGRLLKLDILGHDVPTIIRYLQDTTGIDPTKIDLGDPKVISLFTTPEALGVTPEDIDCKTGSLGLPEFGTSFVRQMLLDTQPKSFAELVRISGLSHGTDVWFNNAQDLIKEGTATLKEVIPTRDDIMVYLINKGVEKKAAFKIMENVRKGKGVTSDEEKTMIDANVPKWYIESCKRIKYMFPKGHAVAYVMMTVRIGYFKIHYPYSFYGASFSVKVEDFDYEMMCQGIEHAREEARKIRLLGKEVSAKEKNSLTILELVIEMYARGLKFLKLDLYKSDAKKFIVTNDGLLPPLSSIQGLGTNAAENIAVARQSGEFFTVEEFRERTKTTKTVIEVLKKLHILDGIPDTNQLTLF